MTTRLSSTKRKGKQSKGIKTIKGQGAYTVADLAKAIEKNKKVLAPLIGAALGGVAGGPAGAATGIALGKAFNVAAGMGAYNVRKNTLASEALVTNEQVPFMHSSGSAMRVAHREYLGDIDSAAAFTVVSWDINPGLPGTFPWLSNLAAAFEKYRFVGLVFYLKSVSSGAAASSHLNIGTGLATIDYSVDSPPPVSKTQMAQQMWAVSGRADQSMLVPVECDAQLGSGGWKFVRTANEVGADKRLSDWGRLDVASDGFQNTGDPSWELWVSYDIDLAQPRLTFGGGALSFEHQSCATAAITSATPLGTQVLHYGNMGITTGTNLITIPAGLAGRFSFMILWTGAAVVPVLPGLTLTTGISQVASFINDTVGSLTIPTVSATQFVYLTMFDFAVTESDKTITFGVAGTVQTTTCDIHIHQVNPLAT